MRQRVKTRAARLWDGLRDYWTSRKSLVIVIRISYENLTPEPKKT